MITCMEISCDWCGRTGEYPDTAAAKADGWYTHQVTTHSAPNLDLSREELVDQLQHGAPVEHLSMGFVCGACVGGQR